MTDLERIIEFMCDVADRGARQKESSRFGVAHLNDDLPRVWGRNYLFANENLGEATAESLAAEAERILGARGLKHRKIELVDAEAGDRLAPGFRELGWTPECDLVMVAARQPEREADLSVVVEVPPEELEPVWAEAGRSDSAVEDDEVVRQLAAGKRVLMETIETHFYGARADGAIGAYCELYSGGGIGQIENVFTLERYRNRGLAAALVLRALTDSRAAGNDLTFLLADRGNWPKELYRKLGFDEIGRIYDFVKPS